MPKKKNKSKGKKKSKEKNNSKKIQIKNINWQKRNYFIMIGYKNFNESEKEDLKSNIDNYNNLF